MHRLTDSPRSIDVHSIQVASYLQGLSPVSRVRLLRFDVLQPSSHAESQIYVLSGLHWENRRGRSRHIPDRRSANISRNQWLSTLRRFENSRNVEMTDWQRKYPTQESERRHNVRAEIVVVKPPRFRNAGNVESL